MMTLTKTTALAILGAALMLVGCDDKGGGGGANSAGSSTKTTTTTTTKVTTVSSGGSAGGSDYVKAYDEYDKAMCACTDMKCTGDVAAKLADRIKGMTPPTNADDATKIGDLTTHASACMTKAMGNMGGAMGTASGKPATSGSAGPATSAKPH